MRSPQRLDFAQLPNQLPRRNRKIVLHLQPRPIFRAGPEIAPKRCAIFALKCISSCEIRSTASGTTPIVFATWPAVRPSGSRKRSRKTAPG
jgi:hypothetical protein